MYTKQEIFTMSQKKEQKSQFMHLELYSRAGVSYTTKNSKIAKTSSGAVINEALRVEGFTEHIIADGFTPTPPAYLYKKDNKPLDQHYKEALEQVATEKDALGRKIKTDKNILLAGVASYPKPRVANWSTDDEQLYIVFKEQTIGFLKKQWGENLICVLEHNDEQYPHLHFYVINEDRVASTPELHPGYAENLRIEKEAKLANTPVNKKEQSAAYKEKMRKFQDEFYEAVGIHCGLDRLGPKVQRLSRTQWRERKRATKLLAKAIDKVKKLQEKNSQHYKMNEEAQNQAMLELEVQLANVVNMNSQLEEEHRILEEGLNDIELAKYVKQNHPQVMLQWKMQNMRKKEAKTEVVNAM